NLFGLPGFDYDRSESIRDDACRPDALAGRLSNAVDGIALEPGGQPAGGSPKGLERVADVPIYFADPVVRRAGSLQHTSDAAPPKAAVSGALIAKLGLAVGHQVRVK